MTAGQLSAVGLQRKRDKLIYVEYGAIVETQALKHAMLNAACLSM